MIKKNHKPTIMHLYHLVSPVKLPHDVWNIIASMLHKHVPFSDHVHCKICKRIYLTQRNGFRNLAHVNHEPKTPYASTIEVKKFKGKAKRRGKFIQQQQWFEDVEETKEEFERTKDCLDDLKWNLDDEWMFLRPDDWDRFKNWGLIPIGMPNPYKQIQLLTMWW